jgi:hypothetical protein
MDKKWLHFSRIERNFRTVCLYQERINSLNGRNNADWVPVFLDGDRIQSPKRCVCKNKQDGVFR